MLLDEQIHNDNFIYMRERILEMLFDYTIDIYRVPVLNTRLLTVEYLANLRDVEQGNTYEKTLGPIVEELLLSLKDDPVIKCIFTTDEKDYIVKRISDKNTVTDGIIYLNNRIGNGVYYTQLRKILKKTILQTKEKKRLERLTRILVSELKSRNYSYQFIYHTAKQCEPSSDASKDFQMFMNNFTLKKKEYIVSLAADISDDLVKEIWGDIERLLPDGIVIFKDKHYIKDVSSTLKKNLNKENPQYTKNKNIQFSSFRVPAMDCFGAAKFASILFDFFTRAHFLLLNEPKSFLIPKCVVSEIIDSNQNINDQLICIDCWTQQHRVIKNNGDIDDSNIPLVKQSQQTLKTLFSRTSKHDDFMRLSTAIDLHNSSLQTNNYHNSFISLWTSLEVLCNGSRDINNIIRACLEMNYIRRIVLNLKNTLQYIDNDSLQAYFKQSKKTDIETYLCSLLFCQSFKEERAKWGDTLSRRPLIRNRIFSFENLDRSLYEEVNRYGTRVSLHVKRMYRTRNGLVHAGEPPKELQTLGEHLHMYLDVLFEEILRHFRTGAYSHLRDVLTAIIYEHDIYMKTLKNYTKKIKDMKDEDELEYTQYLLRQHSE